MTADIYFWTLQAIVWLGIVYSIYLVVKDLFVSYDKPKFQVIEAKWDGPPRYLYARECEFGHKIVGLCSIASPVANWIRGEPFPHTYCDRCGNSGHHFKYYWLRDPKEKLLSYILSSKQTVEKA